MASVGTTTLVAGHRKQILTAVSAVVGLVLMGIALILLAGPWRVLDPQPVPSIGLTAPAQPLGSAPSASTGAQ